MSRVWEGDPWPEEAIQKQADLLQSSIDEPRVIEEYSFDGCWVIRGTDGQALAIIDAGART